MRLAPDFAIRKLVPCLGITSCEQGRHDIVPLAHLALCLLTFRGVLARDLKEMTPLASHLRKDPFVWTVPSGWLDVEESWKRKA